MRSSASTVGVSLSLLGLARNVAAQDIESCADALYILVARGTGEDEGTGLTGPVADAIAERIPGSIVAPLDYPASLTDEFYPSSVNEGVESMRAHLNAYHEACPDGRTAVLGYSQGAQVTTETFCGGDTTDLLGQELDLGEPLSSEIVDNNVAIILFGDPSHNVDASYNYGTSAGDGLFPLAEEETQRCEDLGARIVSYCDDNDIYCDLGGLDPRVHGDYFEIYDGDVVDFVAAQYAHVDGGGSPTEVSPDFQLEPAERAEDSDSDDEDGEDEGEEGAAAWLEPGRGLLYAAPLAAAVAWL